MGIAINDRDVRVGMMSRTHNIMNLFVTFMHRVTPLQPELLHHQHTVVPIRLIPEVFVTIVDHRIGPDHRSTFFWVGFSKRFAHTCLVKGEVVLIMAVAARFFSCIIGRIAMIQVRRNSLYVRAFFNRRFAGGKKKEPHPKPTIKNPLFKNHYPHANIFRQN